MALLFQRGLAIPLWGIAFLAIALVGPPRPMPPVTVLLGIAVFALTMMAIARWRRPSGAHVLVPAPVFGRFHAGIIMTTMSAGTRARAGDRATTALAPDDAIDLVRMDDDGGWQMRQ